MAQHRLSRIAVAMAGLLLSVGSGPAQEGAEAVQAVSDEASAEGEARRGQMIAIRGVIDSGSVNRVVTAARSAVRDGAEVIIFDIQANAGKFGASYDLAQKIVELGGAVRRTVAFVGRPLNGHAVLVALACDEIVMAPEARIGDVYSDPAVDPTLVEENYYRQIARQKGHSAWLAMGMIDRDLRLLEVTTAASKRFLPADELEQFEREARVLKKETIKEKGELLFLDAPTAQRYGLATSIRKTRKDVATAYGLPASVAAEDVLFDEAMRPILLKLGGAIDTRMQQYVQRRLRQAESDGANLLFVEVDSAHGDQVAAAGIASALQGFHGQVVAWVPRQATGAATLILFGCDELVVAPKARLGDFRSDGATPEEYRRLAETALEVAEGSRYPEAIVRGLIDPSVAVFEVRNKRNPQLTTFLTDVDLEQPDVKDEWERARPGPVKGADLVWELDGDQAVAVDAAVDKASTLEELKSRYDLGGTVPVLQPNWVDAIIDALTSTGGTVFLIVVAMTCLYIEFHIPGFGVAGILAAICFGLFFWSRVLSDTANSLEIVLFVMGVALLVLEMFVIPGFGVTGLGGVVLILASLVLASQSFTIPRTEGEALELVGNLATVTVALMVFTLSAAAFARMLPRLPIFGRMMLAPPDSVLATDETSIDGFGPDPYGDASPYRDLLGHTGVAVSPLRPAGRMRFEGRFYDVVAQGSFVELGSSVEVIEVYRNRIVVRDAAPS